MRPEMDTANERSQQDDYHRAEAVDPNRKSSEQLDHHSPKTIGIDGERTRDFENRDLQEGLDIVPGPPGVVPLEIPREGLEGFGPPTGGGNGGGS